MSGKADVELGKASIDTANGYVSKRAQKPAPDETLAEYDSSDSDDELPITANRQARWWYSIFHNITAMIGAGVLGLPQAFKYLGWAGGTITLVLSFIISLWNLRQLCSMHEINGKRMNRYHELGQYAFGQRAGLWAVVPFQLIVMIGLGITYSVTAGKSLQAVYLMCGGSGHVGLSVWIIVFAMSELFASQLPNFNSLAFVSLVAAVMSVTYSTIGWTTAVADGRLPDVEYNLDGVSRLEGIMGCFNALGTIAFAYGGHNVVLEIQATLPKKISVEGGTFKPYMRGVYTAYAFVCYCYFTVAICGYWAFGQAVQDNVLLSIRHPKWVVAVADMFVVVHVFGSYQMYSMPVFDMIEASFRNWGLTRKKVVTRLVMRSLYVVFSCFVAVTLPFFGDLMGFFGAIGFAPTTFWLPSLIWLVVKKPKRNTFSFWFNTFNIVLCVTVMFLAAIGSMYWIVRNSTGYKFYQ
ncbi:TPA: hypothetical protein ACH3X2_000973 [Trebouxia sp. C0005]